jgi:crossover junction endodeoxyribonuclease RuvC
MAVRTLVWKKTRSTAMSVGQASGLALTVAARRGLPVHQYTPNEVKQAIAGYGAADKTQVQAMVTKLLRLAVVPNPPDAADALALAVCHLSAGRFHEAATAGGAGPTPTASPGLARAIAHAIAKEGR